MFRKSMNIVVLFILMLGVKVFASDASLLEFAEGFLPAPVSGSFKEDGNEYVWIRQPATDNRSPTIHKYEAVFSRDKARVWIKREDSAFGVGISQLSDNAPYLKNNHIIYSNLHAVTVYTPLEDQVREDILVASAKDLEKLDLRWSLETGEHLEAKLEPDGAIGIYGPQQYLWGNISIGDEKSAQLLEKARQGHGHRP